MYTARVPEPRPAPFLPRRSRPTIRALASFVGASAAACLSLAAPEARAGDEGHVTQLCGYTPPLPWGFTGPSPDGPCEGACYSAWSDGQCSDPPDSASRLEAYGCPGKTSGEPCDVGANGGVLLGTFTANDALSFAQFASDPAYAGYCTFQFDVLRPDGGDPVGLRDFAIWERDDCGPPPGGSCAGFCGLPSPSGCFCDDVCAEHGDCCPDKGPICDVPCDCPNGTDYHGDPVHSTTCGEPVCGADFQWYSCEPSGWVAQGRACPTEPEPPARHKIRVIEVRYMPDAPDHHPDQLSASLRAALREASSYRKYADADAQPHVEVEVVDAFDHPTARPDGADWRQVYEQVLADHGLCDRIRDEAIDQIWLWVDPATDPRPGLEYVISSPHFELGAKFAYYASPALCGGERSFAIMGFDTTRTYDLAQHSFGHLLEGLLGNLQSVELFWDRFGGRDDAHFPRSQRCGFVHAPPNGAHEYDYMNPAAVTSQCEDWDPLLTGAPSTFGCERWGCTEGGYMTWWMQSLPNEGNGLTYEGALLPNWWDFAFDLDTNIERYENDPAYYMNADFLGPLPFGLVSVDTVPHVLQGDRNLRALFDGVYAWGEDHVALRHAPGEPLGVVLEFAGPTAVAGFSAAVVGDPGVENTAWWVEAADSRADLDAGAGSYRSIVVEARSHSGVVYVPLPGTHTAKVFRVTTRRESGDGAVHVLELSPTFSGGLPRMFAAVETDPAAYPGTKKLPALFDGRGATAGFGVVHYDTPASDSVAVIYDHGDQPLSWYGLRVEAGGYAGNPLGQHWRVEAADSPADLEAHAGSYQLVATESGDASPRDIDFGAGVRARLFKVTLTRNEADGVEHIAEVTPRIGL